MKNTSVHVIFSSALPVEGTRETGNAYNAYQLLASQFMPRVLFFITMGCSVKVMNLLELLSTCIKEARQCLAANRPTRRGRV